MFYLKPKDDTVLTLVAVFIDDCCATWLCDLEIRRICQLLSPKSCLLTVKRLKVGRFQIQRAGCIESAFLCFLSFKYTKFRKCARA